MEHSLYEQALLAFRNILHNRNSGNKLDKAGWILFFIVIVSLTICLVLVFVENIFHIKLTFFEYLFFGIMFVSMMADILIMNKVRKINR